MIASVVDSKSAGTKKKKMLCIKSLITVVAVIVIVVATVTIDNKDGDDDPKPPVHPCTLCPGEKYPTLIHTGMIYDGAYCVDFNESQSKLDVFGVKL